MRPFPSLTILAAMAIPFLEPTGLDPSDALAQPSIDAGPCSSVSYAGMVPGEELRVSLGYLSGPRTENRSRPSDQSFVLRLLEAGGGELFLSDRIEVREGEFRTVAVGYRELGVDGEQRTGRIEVGVQIEATCDRRRAAGHPTSLVQVVDAASGRTSNGWYTGPPSLTLGSAY